MYIWVPLHAPGRSWLHWRHRHDDEGFQEIPQLQVCTPFAVHLSDIAAFVYRYSSTPLPLTCSPLEDTLCSPLTQGGWCMSCGSCSPRWHTHLT